MTQIFRRLLVLLFIAAPVSAFAQEPLQVDITRGNLDPLPIAIPAFIDDGSDNARGADIASVVAADLESSGLFATVDESAFIEEIRDFNLRPRFQDWRLINADALLIGQVTRQADGRLLVGFRLWDTRLQEQLIGLQFVTAPENWRRVAHRVADAVYEQLTGETGYFDTRIVYVSESIGPRGEPMRRLAYMDQDGANPSFLTDRSYWALLPNYSPSAQQITYVSFLDGQATTYVYDLESGRQEALFASGGTGLARIDPDGQSLSARFSPDGEQLAVSIELQAGHDIHLFDLRSRSLRRLTQHPADDVEPSFSPDGERIVFSSSRGGGSQLYVIDADGGGDPQRISFGEGRYTAPVWSPRGDLIAFVKQSGGQFSLGVLDADGSGEERILFRGYYVDTPAWSPNGRVILFTRGERGREGTEYEIWSIDLAGFNLRRAPITGQSSDPAWSPLIE
ncbi:Tol-Pal system beta propeller repeat protein TolB [Hyphobacterium sp. HN65]|uniref:Tol-Pal system protein TolB n=1 Tax=Hyphobacterium lacteum TaxID=3116575 RepID=A0ABU7LPR9_9PROT|nr:Tol-Pal system beta propeller repeat protein TolB [Hyphobacterium sp. HN65]MEE2525910.1 Tol-Pal system beta propeller repeat protein TolB [Hyphobacterium sp. HN65]